MKKKLADAIDTLLPQLIDLSNYIHANPELGHQEYLSSKALADFLVDNGFKMEKPFEKMETAFRARYVFSGTGTRVKIGLLCEYDALEGLGHGCAHNLQGPSIVGTAVALAKVLSKEPNMSGEIIVYGTPAEETKSAKIPMVKNGIFEELDIALMMHGGDRTTVDTKSLAMNLVNFIYDGIPSHAALAAEKGRSALDGVIQLFNGLEYLREHVPSDVRIHGIIKDGGTAANIVPQHAVAQFYVRAYTREVLDEVMARVEDVAKGAALMTGTSVKIEIEKSLDNKINVQSLNDVLLNNAKHFELPNITPPRDKTGSTDFSSVTYRIPGSCLRVSFVPLGVPNHTHDWVEASNSPQAHLAIGYAAKVLSSTCYELFTNPNLLVSIKEEFKRNKTLRG